MPLLYGEGRGAFIRLQHEIIKASDDHSLFACTGEGMLARSPNQFRQSGWLNLLRDSGESQIPYSITNKGLHIQLNYPSAPLLKKNWGWKKRWHI
jgi:hypothetical protein